MQFWGLSTLLTIFEIRTQSRVFLHREDYRTGFWSQKIWAAVSNLCVKA